MGATEGDSFRMKHCYDDPNTDGEVTLQSNDDDNDDDDCHSTVYRYDDVYHRLSRKSSHGATLLAIMELHKGFHLCFCTVYSLVGHNHHHQHGHHNHHHQRQ